MQGIESVLINVTENKLKCTGKPNVDERTDRQSGPLKIYIYIPYIVFLLYATKNGIVVIIL